MAYMHGPDDDAAAEVAADLLRKKKPRVTDVSIQASDRIGIYTEIETQVHVANEEHGGPEHDDRHTPQEWEAMIVNHLYRSRHPDQLEPLADMTTGARIQYRRQMIRVAQLAIAAIETLDRHEDTLPERRLR